MERGGKKYVDPVYVATSAATSSVVTKNFLPVDVEAQQWFLLHGRNDIN